MKYSDIKAMTTAIWTAPGGNMIPFLLLGKPGGGKSALAMDVVRSLGGNDDNTVVFTPSLRDPVDVLGTPNNNGDYTRWVPPMEFYKLRYIPGDDSPKFLVIEELSDASVAMMNAMCRIVHDRHAGDLSLSNDLYIFATGNRTEDKSGANRLTTKLGNRLCVLEYDENLDDWVDWALQANLDPVDIQFLRFKPNLLSDFDPNRPYGINPTPRQWEKVARLPKNLPTELYFAAVRGLVGEGAAAEHCAFRKIYDSLISFEDIVMNPEKVAIPKDLSAQYAIVGSLTNHTNPNNIERVEKFVSRLPVDFSVMFWQDAVKRTPKLRATKAFIQWASSNSNVLTNG